MADEKMILRLSALIDRRAFLRRVGAAALGAVAALVGTPGLALALYNVYCCHLCQPNSGSCSNCACTWCWMCTYNLTHDYSCCECHRDNDYCLSGCSNVPCSYAVYLGRSPIRSGAGM